MYVCMYIKEWIVRLCVRSSGINMDISVDTLAFTRITNLSFDF